MPFLIVSVILQVALVLHIVKTGRSTTWIWIVLMLPLAGSIAYVIVALLPGIIAGRRGRRAHKNLKQIVNPNKNFNSATRDFSISGTVENSTNLAEEYLNKKMFEEARVLFEKSLTGIYENSPDIMFGLARAEFGLTHYGRVKEILDALIVVNPDYKNAHAHLLFARTAEKLDDIDLALQEFEVLDNYFTGPEASYRYGLLLKKSGQAEKAEVIFGKIIDYSKTSGKHYNTIYKEWISCSKSECKS